MIRKFNYTRRRKISGDATTIRLICDRKEKSFEADIRLQDMRFPEHAKVYLEAYYKTNYMRFPFGTVNNIHRPYSTILTDFTNTDLIYFRVKIVDESETIGKILGFVSGLEPKDTDREQKHNFSILSVNYDADLGQKLYNLETEEIENLPILEINRKLENGSVIVTSDIFITTIYPSVIRELASEIINDDTTYTEEDDCWQGYWIKYFRHILGASIMPPQRDDDRIKKDWIEDTVNAFCNKYRVRSRYTALNIS